MPFRAWKSSGRLSILHEYSLWESEGWLLKSFSLRGRLNGLKINSPTITPFVIDRQFSFSFFIESDR